LTLRAAGHRPADDGLLTLKDDKALQEPVDGVPVRQAGGEADLPVRPPEAWYALPNFPTVKGRFIDLVLRRPPIAVGIEWKPWANEGTDELEDYARDLRDLAPENHWLVFAPGTRGIEAGSISPETRQVLHSRFVTVLFERAENGASIIDRLEACSKVCAAENVRRFILDLLR
jgi:hypothetical protein